MIHLVKVSHNVQDLTGIGLEYLVDETGEIVLAKFIDGVMNPDDNQSTKIQGNEDVTRKAA